MRTPRIVAAVIAVASCGESSPPTDHTCATNPDPHCTNPIDEIVVPKLRDLGAPIRDATGEELCRRMAIDLLGRGPAGDELAMCRNSTPGAIFDAFVAKPEYLREQRRAWGELFKYDDLTIRGDDLVDLDSTVGDLYAERIDYAEFARRVAMHPTLEGLHPADSWTTNMFQLFLGRPARADEIDGLRPMTLAWSPRLVCDGAVWFNFYQMARQQGASDATARAQGDAVCPIKLEWGLNLCGCQPGFFSDGCKSDTLGAHVEIPGTCANPNNYYDPINFVRASDRTPGDHTCPDGTTMAECNDRLVDYTNTAYTFSPFVPWVAPSSDVVAGMHSVGDALAQRGDFWEAAADRELHRLLGWWQATFRHPDSDLPEVRALLADKLKKSGSIRAVQRLIVTSLLYAQPADAPQIAGVDDMPPWVAGPTKLLAGEAWLATAARGVGESPASCDYRAVTTGGYAPYFLDARLLETAPGTLDESAGFGYSVAAIGRLAGCSTDSKRPEVSNIGLTFNEADISRTLCAYGRKVIAPGFTNDFAGASTTLIETLWHRSPRDGEVDAMVADMQACVGSGATTGCADGKTAVRWMCQRMLDSAEFATY